jgi:phosphoglycolate phosphatase
MGALIAFDLDGTIVDSQLDLAESANELLASYGAGPLAVAEVAAMVGDGAMQLVRRALRLAQVRADPSAALERFLQIYATHLVVHTRPYDGLPKIIEAAAARAPLAVLTNKPEQLSRRLLEAFNLARFFPDVIGGDSGFPRKPDATGLRHLVTAAGATPQSTLFVGDSMIDLETARRAGACPCLARYGFGHLRHPIALAGDELVADRPDDLGPLIDAFLDRSETTT